MQPGAQPPHAGLVAEANTEAEAAAAVVSAFEALPLPLLLLAVRVRWTTVLPLLLLLVRTVAAAADDASVSPTPSASTYTVIASVLDARRFRNAEEQLIIKYSGAVAARGQGNRRIARLLLLLSTDAIPVNLAPATAGCHFVAVIISTTIIMMIIAVAVVVETDAAMLTPLCSLPAVDITFFLL